MSKPKPSSSKPTDNSDAGLRNMTTANTPPDQPSPGNGSSNASEPIKDSLTPEEREAIASTPARFIPPEEAKPAPGQDDIPDYAKAMGFD